ncbi:outer membrane protein assembly factor BamA, partial [candidate division KSB1 bacterium]|nr:outer membrane protein assembly factor BamA [candidate division KSB1 bacterium]NIR69370.1 outer membrane protein assembly factor BamA [candidate division KSB1 bacterium]NIS24188.1 outer membrane protein assembly factor BamA [candidate division KSB1 bacterium]NIT71103.1 outer membrane protein assembly factor BamA [candidate division KSB1 bacterium]NIU24807.1 outer membrane protein assembly factor BamA [candidate division KSB1 bacterium]
NSGLAVNETITGEDIQKAIKQLWSLKMFSDIQVVLEKQVGESVYLKIKVEEYPRLERIELEGNDKLKKKDIEKELDFYRGQVISPQEIKRAKEKIAKLYEEKGYLLADIEPQTRDGSRDEKIVLRFKIKEGNKVKIEGITFHGNQAFSDGELRGQLENTEEDGFLFFGGGDFDPEKYREDRKKLISFYHKEGFRDAEVLRDSIYYGPDKKSMYIDIWVREGIQYYFGDITWEGQELFTEEQLNSFLDFNKGDVYNKEKIEKAVFERIGGLYYDAGYIYASVTPQETPVGKDTVDVHFRVIEGNAVSVRKIHILGNTKTKEKVIRRELKIRPGDTFSREALMRSQREIFVLNYFADVRPDVRPVNDEEVDVTIEVEEKSTDTANMSAGFSERDKLIGSIGVTMNNFMGNGQTLSFDWNFGRAFRSIQVGFTEPWLFDTPTLFGINLYDTKRDRRFTGYDQRSQGGSLRLGRRLRWPDNFFRVDWIYRIDRTNLSNFIEQIEQANPNGIATQQWPLTTSSLTQIVTRNSLDRPEFPTRGSKFTYSTEISGGLLGGNVSFHKHTIQNEWFAPAFFNFVLFNNFQAGYIEGFGSDAANIPFLEHFFMGGEGLSRSIPLRGYDDPLSNRALTPGGKVMFKYSTELRFPISPNPTIFGLAFAEAGNTWESLSETDLFDLRRSVGVGVRIFMPMLGIIGFDYAFGFDNIDRLTGEKFGEWKPHFVFGRSF